MHGLVARFLHQVPLPEVSVSQNNHTNWDPSLQHMSLGERGGIVHTQIIVGTSFIGPRFPPQTQALHVLQVPSEGNQ